MSWRGTLACFATLAMFALAAQATPDFTGVWQIRGKHAALRTTDGNAPPLKPAAKQLHAQRLASAARGDRSFDESQYCLPPGLPRLMLIDKPFEILQRKKVIYFVHQDNRLPRRAYLDEPLPADPEPFYLGHSVAHWEDDTLVIESVGFRATTLLDDSGLPHSAALRLTERYRLDADAKTLRSTFTIDDPKVFTRPWSAQVEYAKQPDLEIPEEVCAEKLESTHPNKRQ